MPRETWTDKELAFLRDNHDKMSRKAIAAALGYNHTEAAVRSRLMQLDLTSKATASERMSAMNEKGDGEIGYRPPESRLTVISEKRKVPQGKFCCYEVTCRCDCGKEVNVLLTNLRRGRTKSCGCMRDENTAERSRTHGMTKSRLYHIWASMKDRCLNENNSHYGRYGGRGIKTCDDWTKSFESFRDWALSAGYADDLEIDRKDYDGNYEPINCRWVTTIQQQNNKSTNRLETYEGETKTLAEWARDKRCDVGYDVLSNRVNKLKWPFGIALTTHLRGRYYRNSSEAKSA